MKKLESSISLTIAIKGDINGFKGELENIYFLCHDYSPNYDFELLQEGLLKTVSKMDVERVVFQIINEVEKKDIETVFIKKSFGKIEIEHNIHDSHEVLKTGKNLRTELKIFLRKFYDRFQELHKEELLRLYAIKKADQID